MPVSYRRDYARYQKIFLDILSQYRKRQDVKMFLELLLSLMTIIIFTLFALRPTFLTVSALIQEIKNKEETIAKMNQKIEDLSSAQDVVTREASRIELLRRAVPAVPIPETMVRQIEGVAGRSGAVLEGLSIGELTLLGPEKEVRKKTDLTPLPEGAGAVSLSVSASGEYSSLVAFARNLENLLRPLWLDNLSISALEGRDQAQIILTTAVGRAPYLKQ